MSETHPDLAEAQDELQVLVEQLKGIQKSLRSLRGRLPAPTAGGVEGENEEQSDVAQELTSVIDCVLTDSVGPAIRDLEAASLYRGKKEG
jgi:hypothetical protein